MLPPLDTRVLSALVCDDDDADSEFVVQAKRRLNIDRNLSHGVLLLLFTYGRFLAQLYEDEVPMSHNRKGADSWHIGFRDPPFNELRIYSTSTEGVIDIHVGKKPFLSPFLSFWIFDNPQNWQAMLQWLWEYGDKREIARSIPQLDPQRMRVLVEGDKCAIKCDHVDSLAGFQVTDVGLFIRNARKALMKGNVSKGMYKVFLAFQIFKPSMHRNTPSTSPAGVRQEQWRMLFLVSPFRSLHLQPGDREDVVDIYAFKKIVKSLQITSDPLSWQALLKWVWDYGNRRHIEKTEYEASRRRNSTKLKSRRKRPHAEKPLLHQVLRTAGFKAQGEPKMKPNEMVHKAKAVETVTDGFDRMPRRRRALNPANPNRQTAKSRLSTCVTFDEGDENVAVESKG